MYLRLIKNIFIFFVWGLVESSYASGVAEVQPHRAFYTVSLASTPYSNSQVSDIRGTMMIEVDKVCGGWTVQHKLEAWLFSNDGSREHVKWGYVTWESDDGRQFQFNTYRKSNNEVVEEVRGRATRQDSGVEISYERPRKQKEIFSREMLFPIQHLHSLLQEATVGNKVYSRVVFDGSDITGPSEIDAFIGMKKEVKEDGKNHLFIHQPFWSIRFAVYGLGKGNDDPEFVTSQELLSNGVIKEFTIEYGGVKIKGIPDRIELLTPKGC